MHTIERVMALARDKLDFLLPSFVSKGFYQYEPRSFKDEKYKQQMPCQPPRISVVVPTYNQAEFIERTIISVFDQEYPNLELIIVDGGSSDESVGIIRKYESRLHWWCSEHDNGQADAINKGFRHSTGDILAWLNADDCYLENTLAKIGSYIVAKPDIDVVYGNRMLIDENDKDIGRWILPPHVDSILSWVDFIPQETLFWRRNIWEKIGAYINVSYDFAMDWELLLRFRSVRAKIVHLPHYLGKFRVHEKQKTSLRIDDVGHKEMQRLQNQCLGYTPTRLQCAIGVAGYLLKARFHELLHKRS